jgi:hypothetical protein
VSSSKISKYRLSIRASQGVLEINGDREGAGEGELGLFRLFHSAAYVIQRGQNGLRAEPPGVDVNRAGTDLIREAGYLPGVAHLLRGEALEQLLVLRQSAPVGAIELGDCRLVGRHQPDDLYLIRW